MLAAGLFIGLTLPPRAASVAAALPPTQWLGAYHIHSTASDGSGSVDDIAAAARRAGLQFIILTDHGDATRTPMAPAYRDGVLVIDAVEINTTGGHLVALGLTGASPYPLAGLPRDVIEDVHRQGGMAIVAHPDSPRPDLRWRTWNVPFDGIEWLNADAEWRDEPRSRLLALFGRQFLRPAETIASVFSRPDLTLHRWDDAGRRGPIVGLAADDAHAWRLAKVLPRPRYQDMFEALDQVAILIHPPTTNAAADAADVLDAIRRGRTFSVVRGIADPAALTFTADVGSASVSMGGVCEASGAPVTFRASVAGVAAASLTLLRDGRPVAVTRGHLDRTEPDADGVYRVEVRYPGNDMPWLVSNPIYVGAAWQNASARPGPARDTPVPPERLLDLTGSATWKIEKDASSSGRIEPDGGALKFSYELGGGAPAGQYAGAVVDVAAQGGFDRVQLVVRADQPRRLSLQVRLPGGHDGWRWRRAIYVDTEPRTVVVPLEEFEPVDRETSQQPIAASIRKVYLVADTLNSRPGSRGTVWITAVGLGRAPEPPAVVER